MHLIILTVLTGLFALMAYVFYDVGSEYLNDTTNTVHQRIAGGLIVLSAGVVAGCSVYAGWMVFEGLSSSRAHAQCAFCSNQPCFTRDACGGGTCVCLKHGQSQRGECVSLE